MKHKNKYWLVAAMLAAIIFAFAACDNPTGGIPGDTTEQELADKYKAGHAEALALKETDISDTGKALTYEATVNNAITAYNALDANVQVLLTAQKTLLDSLKTKIYELIAATTAQELAETFKDIFADALDLNIKDLTPLNEGIINNAIAVYDTLRADAQALLVKEKELLDSLKEAVGELPNRITITNITEWNEALLTIAGSSFGTSTYQKYYTLTIGGDFSVSGSTANSFGSAEYITVVLNGIGTIGLSGNGNLLRIGSNQTLVIDSKTLTLSGHSGNTHTVVYAAPGSELELRNGTISGNTGGGVYVESGTFTMSGGSISENSGGGVSVSSGTFTMDIPRKGRQ